ncbi:unnamed protein product [Mytilus coruscus]|uniref:HECT domain-containing protein n=1 Tax=Mytilus coruscus TaxID=42192 RepID=A0A6J8C5T4_MYTCO|nr:unnamed protein product [Mytilus coruscus]
MWLDHEWVIFVPAIDQISDKPDVEQMQVDRYPLSEIHRLSKTPIKVEVLLKLVTNYPNQVDKQILSDGFIYSFKVGYEGPRMSTNCHNLISAYQNKKELEIKLADGLAAACYLFEKFATFVEWLALCLQRGVYLANLETLEEAMLLKYELQLMKTGGRRGMVDLRCILRFATGTEEDPSLGYSINPSIHFVEGSSFMPTANTCINKINLTILDSHEVSVGKDFLFNLFDYTLSYTYFGMR